MEGPAGGGFEGRGGHEFGVRLELACADAEEGPQVKQVFASSQRMGLCH